MRLEKLTDEEEDRWRAEFGRENWLLGALSLSVTLPEYGGGRPQLRAMHFGYYLQSLHLAVMDREDLPRKLLWVLARRSPSIDFLELTGAGIRIPHAFPPSFTLERVLRITIMELRKLPLYGDTGTTP